MMGLGNLVSLEEQAILLNSVFPKGNIEPLPSLVPFALRYESEQQQSVLIRELSPEQELGFINTSINNFIRILNNSSSVQEILLAEWRLENFKARKRKLLDIQDPEVEDTDDWEQAKRRQDILIEKIDELLRNLEQA